MNGAVIARKNNRWHANLPAGRQGREGHKILRLTVSAVYLYLLHKEQNPEECDARDNHLCY